MTRYQFTSEQHLRSQKDFERVYSLKTKAADGVILLFIARNNLEVTRIGLSVSKKHGGAVVRNRLKRLLREAFRLSQHQIPNGLDLIAIPLAAENASLSAYQESLTKISSRLASRLERSMKSNEAPP